MNRVSENLGPGKLSRGSKWYMKYRPSKLKPCILYTHGIFQCKISPNCWHFASSDYRYTLCYHRIAVVCYRHVINYLKWVLLRRSKTVFARGSHNTSMVAAQCNLLCELLFWSGEEELISGEIKWVFSGLMNYGIGSVHRLTHPPIPNPAF